MSEAQFTDHTYADEPSAIADLRMRAESSELFADVITECTGQYYHPRMRTREKDARIDMMLIPSQYLESLGWVSGPFGVEIKGPSVKLDPVISQALDYSRCLFNIHLGWHIAIEWVFIFPVSLVTGCAASIGANQRIGTGSICGSYAPRANRMPIGRKRGSR